jgi:hypothetical protein
MTTYFPSSQQIRVEHPPHKKMKSLYTEATLAVQINGNLHGPIQILCGVQGCPLSMTLYTLCLQTFLNLLEQRLPGIRIGRSHRPISVVAYVDDITIFLSSRNDIPIIEDAIRIFEEASGTHNTRKSKALPIGTWNTTINIIGIQYQPHVQILGIHFWNKIQKSIQATWTQLTGRVST